MTDSGYILKVEPAGFPNGSNLWGEREQIIQGNFKGQDLNN